MFWDRSVLETMFHKGNHLCESTIFDPAYAGAFWKMEMQETLQLNKYLRLMAHFR